MRINCRARESIWIMPSPKCPFCSHQELFDLRTYGFYKGPVTCEECTKRYYVAFGNVSPLEDQWDPNPGGQLLSPIRPVGDPGLLEGLDDLFVPKSILRSFAEASECADYGIPRAAAVLCRMVVQEALLGKGIPDGPPEKMVNIARSKGILGEVILRQCSAAVFLGGKGAHPQVLWTDIVGPHEALEALLLTRRVLMELFNLPF